MTPEANRFLVKAHTLLRHAATMLGVALYEDAGRNAYLAGFHAAQAYVFEVAGKVVKSHKGVQMEFLRLTKGDPRFTAEQKIFLSQRYNLKAMADYETDPSLQVSEEIAVKAVGDAKQFVSHIAALLAASHPPP